MDERTFRVKLHFTGIEARVVNDKLRQSEAWQNWVVAEQSGKCVALTDGGFVAARSVRDVTDEAIRAAYLRRNEMVRKYSCEVMSPVLSMQSAVDVVLLSNMLESHGAVCIDSYKTVVITLDKPRRWRRASRDSLVKTLTWENRLLYTLFAYSPLRQKFCDSINDYPGWQSKANRLAADRWFHELMVGGLIADGTNIASTLHYRGLLERCVAFE